jgi:putative RNA 2'-phosphotransferase
VTRRPYAVSRTISYWLRHAPQEADLVADEYGWVALDDLLAALQDRDIAADLEFLQGLNASTDKVRWLIEPDNNRIRATHGHSIPIIIDDTQEPPPTLYHGTAVKTWPSIAAQGLRPMGRRFVHLTDDLATARAVGARHGRPLVIGINAERLAATGQPFHHTSDNVWLTDTVPVAYLLVRKPTGPGPSPAT